MQNDDGRLPAAAQRLAADGTPVFPCGSDKAPLVAGGFKAATCDLQQVRDWWRRDPGALIGVPTGAASGLVVLDLDVKGGRDGVAVFEALRAGREMPAGPSIRTRSGGLHLYLLASPARPFRCSVGRLGPGIDVRAEGGYVVVPPSPGYWQERPGHPGPVPAWLLALLDPPEPPEPLRETMPPRIATQASCRVAALARRVANAAEGERNNLLYWGACRLAEAVLAGQLSERAAAVIAEEAGRIAGLSHLEARRTVASAFRTVLKGPSRA
jgi:hypothetical protein